VRWTRPRSWHLTLLFLGAVDAGRAGELEALVARVAGESRPYPARVDVGDGRLRRGEGVAWLGLSEGAGRLIELADRVVASCPPDITDGTPPRRTPSAHLTLVRRADAAVVEALRSQSHGALGVGWTVDRLCLVRSHLGPDGAKYETLSEAAL
jgi:2'-5' RNA ligase